jgi:hypothetical protein
MGYARLAQPGFVGPYWSPITVQPAGLDRFSIVDDPSRSVVDCAGTGSSCKRWSSFVFTRWFEVCKTVLDADLEHAAHVPAKTRTPALSLVSPTVVPALLNGSAFDFNGAFSGHYPSKGCLDTVTLARVGREQINATKVTGTVNVPAGKTTFYFDTATLIGYARLAQPGFVGPYWAPITVQPAGLDRFDVVDDPSRPVVDCAGTGSSCKRWSSFTFNRWFEVCAH